MQKSTATRGQTTAMGTRWEWVLRVPDETAGAMLCECFIESLSLWERTWSRFYGAAEVCRLNRLLPNETAVVDPLLAPLLTIATEAWHATNGIFNIAVGITGDVNRAEPAWSWNADERRFAWRIPARQLDLGGLAKGYACDLLTQSAREAGCQTGMIIGGGSSLRVWDDTDDPLAVRVALHDPRSPRSGVLLSPVEEADMALETINLCNESLSYSVGIAINDHSGASSRGTRRPDGTVCANGGVCAVLGKSAVWAEIASTTGLIVGESAMFAYSDKWREGSIHRIGFAPAGESFNWYDVS